MWFSCLLPGAALLFPSDQQWAGYGSWPPPIGRRHGYEPGDESVYRVLKFYKYTTLLCFGAQPCYHGCTSVLNFLLTLLLFQVGTVKTLWILLILKLFFICHKVLYAYENKVTVL